MVMVVHVKIDKNDKIYDDGRHLINNKDGQITNGLDVTLTVARMFVEWLLVEVIFKTPACHAVIQMPVRL